ncbi:MAG: hypothetical protein ACI9R3_004423 [Verrucomicrobiales bacterium]
MVLDFLSFPDPFLLAAALDFAAGAMDFFGRTAARFATFFLAFDLVAFGAEVFVLVGIMRSLDLREVRCFATFFAALPALSFAEVVFFAVFFAAVLLATFLTVGIPAVLASLVARFFAAFFSFFDVSTLADPVRGVLEAFAAFFTTVVFFFDD